MPKLPPLVLLYSTSIVGRICVSPICCFGSTTAATNEAVTKTMDRLKEALGEAKTNLTAAQERTKRQVDTSRRSETFAVGDEVVVTTKHLRTYAPHLPMKLKRRWIGPFCITG